MTTTPASPAASQQAAVDAALLILERMGLSPDDLTAAPRQRPSVPTFAHCPPGSPSPERQSLAAPGLLIFACWRLHGCAVGND
jgi:hypothetical protein